MDANALNDALVDIIRKKEALGKLDYNDERYDELEEELHDLEDGFNDTYGDYLEDVLERVHQKLKSDADILLPTAYLASSLNGSAADAPGGREGVWVESDEFPGVEMRLVLIANPVRFVLLLGDQQREIWTSE